MFDSTASQVVAITGSATATEETLAERAAPGPAARDPQHSARRARAHNSTLGARMAAQIWALCYLVDGATDE